MKEENIQEKKGSYSRNEDLDVSLVLSHWNFGVFGPDPINTGSFHRFLILYLKLLPSIKKG